MAKSLANVYTITGLPNLVVGGTIMTATAVAGAALPQGYAQAAFGSSSIFGKLTDQNRRETTRVLKSFQKQLEKNWADWSDMPKARAAMGARDFITPDDLKGVFLTALRHRVALDPAEEIGGGSTDAVLRGILDTVEVPR